MPNQLALPDMPDKLKSIWKSPEGVTAALVLIAIGGSVLGLWAVILPFLLGLVIDTLHLAYLAGILAAISYLAFSSRMHLFYRVILRKLTSLVVPVYAKEIVLDKLSKMKQRREKMNVQIGFVKGNLVKIQRVIAQNHADAVKGFGMASQAQKMAGQTQDENEQLRMQLAMKQQARRAQRREQANIGYTSLLERLNKIYNFLTRYAANIDFFIEDMQDEIEQKTTEYDTTQSAYGAMKQAMAVIKGNATEEDIYDQAFASMEKTVSTQLGIMDDLQRVSQNFMDGMDIEKGSVDDAALQALNAFEQKALTAGNSDFKMFTTDKSAKLVPVPASGQRVVNGNTFDDLLK